MRERTEFDPKLDKLVRRLGSVQARSEPTGSRIVVDLRSYNGGETKLHLFRMDNFDTAHKLGRISIEEGIELAEFLEAELPKLDPMDPK